MSAISSSFPMRKADLPWRGIESKIERMSTIAYLTLEWVELPNFCGDLGIQGLSKL